MEKVAKFFQERPKSLKKIPRVAQKVANFFQEYPKQ